MLPLFELSTTAYACPAVHAVPSNTVFTQVILISYSFSIEKIRA